MGTLISLPIEVDKELIILPLLLLSGGDLGLSLTPPITPQDVGPPRLADVFGAKMLLACHS